MAHYTLAELCIAAAAEVLGTTEGAVKLRAYHAYQRIREELDRLERRAGYRHAAIAKSRTFLGRHI